MDGVETPEFVSNTFDVETPLVPGIENAKYASLPNRVAKIASSPSCWVGVTLVGVGVGVGVEVGVGVGWVEMSGVEVVWWGVSDELVDEELLMGSVKSEAVELLLEVFCELFV